MTVLSGLRPVEMQFQLVFILVWNVTLLTFNVLSKL
jgi:hypothetical protein